MPIIRLPGTVSRPAETMVKQMDLISSIRVSCISRTSLVNVLSFNFASGSLRMLPVMQGLSDPSSICFFNLLSRNVRYLSLRSRYSDGWLLALGRRRMSGI